VVFHQGHEVSNLEMFSWQNYLGQDHLFLIILRFPNRSAQNGFVFSNSCPS
jgi:hypothetical protein